MAVLLDITYSKKLGLPNYSSHSLGIGLKAEAANLDEVGGRWRRRIRFFSNPLILKSFIRGSSRTKTREKTEPIKSKKHK